MNSRTRWQVMQRNETEIQSLVESLNITPLVASLLVNRGFNTVETARSFLNIEKEPFHDPFLLDGMERVVERIQLAINQNERILVFGDYDADGVSSTTIMVSVLKKMGAHVDFYIPNRFTEGYGPNEAAFRAAKDRGFHLIISVDTGISALHEAKVAKELGIDFIITDHHEPGPELPDAYEIIHPKKPGGSYPFHELAGVGVAFKIAHALRGEIPADMLDIAAIGTIADLVPLHGENRLLAKLGIEKLQTTKRPGIKALLKVCGVTNQTEVNEETIGFGIAPRINAVGRLDDADPAVHLLLTEDHTEAAEIAGEVDAYNKERQQIVSEITEEAIKEVEKNFSSEDHSVLVIAKKGWNAGVVGIVASRLVEKFYKPTIVLSINPEKGEAKGSARSIEGFDLFKNLSKCRDILPHFGGHTMAAGMTLLESDVPTLRERLNQLANETLTKEDYTPVTPIDVVCPIEEISIQSIEEMQQLAPYGMKNPKPYVLVQDVNFSSVKKIGTSQNHLKLILEKDGVSLDSVGFGLGSVYHELSPMAMVSAVGELSINEWNNFRKPQLMIKDLKVDEWQLYDYRGIRDIDKMINTLPIEKVNFIVFQPESFSKLSIKDEIRHQITTITSEEDLVHNKLANPYTVLIDLPTKIDLFKALVKMSSFERIYTIFHQEQNHFFSTIPTRDHFKWFYAFLAKKGSFHLDKHAGDLAKHRGWTKETVEFMSKVFFDLEFVKIENGFISLSNETKVRRDLTESKTYQEKQEQLELENLLLYSSYHELKQWFDLNRGAKELAMS